MSTKIVDDEEAKHEWIGEPKKQCFHPEHNPPGHIVIPPGKKLVHKCPGCGKETVIRERQVFSSFQSGPWHA